MSDTLALGRLIRESRLKKGMSLGQLAAAVGRSSSSVRRWERGEVPPAAGIIDDLAGALDLDPEELRKLRPAPITASTQVKATSQPPTASQPKRPTTLEQPVVPTGNGQRTTNAGRDDAEGSSTRQRGFVGDVFNEIAGLFRDWHGWIRGLLTVAAFVALGILLVWALGEMFGALGEVWDSFGVGG